MKKYQENLYKIYPLSLHYFQTKKYQQKDALRLMEAKLNLLKDTGYIQDRALTPKGQFAKSVYGYELILSEFYARNYFEQMDEFTLGILAVAAVFEPRKNQHILSLSKKQQKYQKDLRRDP